jgi:hypothetical protein
MMTPVDRVPSKLPSCSSRLIAMAVSLVGEAQSVMLEMRCSRVDFRDYCLGWKEPSAEEFDRLIDLIVIEQRKMIDRNRELIARIGERDDAPD